MPLEHMDKASINYVYRSEHCHINDTLSDMYDYTTTPIIHTHSCQTLDTTYTTVATVRLTSPDQPQHQNKAHTR